MSVSVFIDGAVGTTGIDRRMAVLCMRSAFNSGRNNRIRPSLAVCAFRPSKHCCA